MKQQILWYSKYFFIFFIKILFNKASITCTSIKLNLSAKYYSDTQ